MPDSPHDPPQTVSVRPGTVVQTPTARQAAVAAAAALAVPGWPVIPGYEIAGELGRGGMGVVYEARQAALRRTVALKVVLAGAHAGPSEHDRFRTEAEAIARLQHPNIVQVFDVGRHADLPYLTLEYVEGGSLARALAGGPLPPRRAAELATALADAAHYAHRHGIVHRDLTPANVLLTADGSPKVSDFGLAKLLVGGSGVKTQTGAVLGTPPYMSPEQAAGTAVGPATDVYGLGALLYEMLTGRPPFRADSVLETLRQVQEVEPVPPKRLNAAVPRDLETICLKCLQKEPTRRYVSAEALAADLRAWLDGRPVSARPVGVVERAARWARRSPAVAGLATTVAALLLALGVGGTVAAVLLKGQRDAALANLGRAEEAEKATRRELGGSLLAQAAAVARGGLPGQRFAALDLLGRAAKELAADPTELTRRAPELRELLLTAHTLPDLREVARVTFPAAMSHAADPTLTYAAALESATGQVSVRRFADGAEVVRLPPPELAFWYGKVAFAPDGRSVLVDYNAHGEPDLLQLWSLDGPRLVRSWRGGRPTAFHPDGRRLFSVQGQGELTAWDLTSGRVEGRWPLGFPVKRLCFDAAGGRVALARGDADRLAVYDLAAGRVAVELGPQAVHDSVAWSADGRLIAVNTAAARRVVVWDVTRRERIAELRGHVNNVLDIHFVGDGYKLATWSWDATARLWDAATGEQVLLMPGVTGLGFDAAGRRLATVGGPDVTLWELADDSVCRDLVAVPVGNADEVRSDGAVNGAAFDPTGRWFAAAYADGVALYAAADGRRLARLPAGPTNSVSVRGDALVARGSRGVYRWPIRGTVIGPPELLWDDPADGGSEYTAPGPGPRAVGVIDNANRRVVLLDATAPDPPRSRPPALAAGDNGRMTTLSFSPDGRWAAAGGWRAAGVYVWDVPARRLAHVLKPAEAGVEAVTFAGFSADGRWLVWSASDAVGLSYQFRRVGTWEKGPTVTVPPGTSFPAAPVFSPDGRLMAGSVAAGSTGLLDPTDGRELARLTSLQPLNPAPLAFSPDGSRLVARTNRQTMLLWDLRVARAKLAALGVDWDRPPYDPVPPAEPVPEFQVVGQVFEPDARRTAEMAAADMHLLHVNPFDADALVRRGWLHAKAQRFREAAADFDLAGRLRPNHPTAHRWLAQMRQQLNDTAGVFAALERHLKHHAGDLDNRLTRGRLAFERGDAATALDDATAVLAAGENATARLLRGRALVRLGRPGEALPDFDAAVAVFPKDAEVYVRRAGARQRAGDRAGAEADRAAAVAIDPADGDVYNSLAWFLLTAPPASRDDARALDLAKKAVELDAANANHRNTLGVALCRTGKYAEAVPELERSLAASKGQSDGFDLYFLAICHAKRGDAAKAKDCFDRAVLWHEAARLTPDHREELKAFQAEAEVVVGGK